MDYNLLEVAFGALLHDIGKFYQRTKHRSDLSEEEERLTPMLKKYKGEKEIHTHLHSGYTSRFFHEFLNMNSEYEMLTSAHHKAFENDFAKMIELSDQIASAIDRKDEDFDNEENNQRGAFQSVRLSSIFEEIDFGKKKNSAKFMLSPMSDMPYPYVNYIEKNKADSVKEYQRLFTSFTQEFENDPRLSGKVDKYCFDRVYALLNEYTTTIPASTFEGKKTYVSLFDHLKLSSAIASCLYFQDANERFYMLEFDVSGIQKFIFKVTEGKDTKQDVAKSLRGRSMFVSLITDVIAYRYLHAFGLTQSNIIFNTGGGALLLLPAVEDFEERIRKVSDSLSEALYEAFSTDITYVYAYVDCNQEELEKFKKEKAIELKCKLDEAKSRKYAALLKEDFFYQSAQKKNICELCGANLTDGNRCDVCQKIIQLSDFLVKHERMYMVFDFSNKMQQVKADKLKLEIAGSDVYLAAQQDFDQILGHYDYVESFNHAKIGRTRLIANQIPLSHGNVMTFEEISENLIDPSYGDKKLGVLKMDVDNLGAIFAFGLKDSRSLSKFLTLSRLTELFFSDFLVKICKDVSRIINPRIDDLTDNGTMFYINYAGGDDLVILGPAAGILKLAQEIHQCFTRFTENDNMTISGGIHIQNPKEPIRFGIQRAEENLEKSKQHKEKNAITLIDTTCGFKEYQTVLREAEYFKQLMDTNKISRTLLYSYMVILDRENLDDYYRMIPKLLYSLKRNIAEKDDKIRRDLVEKLSRIREKHALAKLVLELKLAIMQTRQE